MIALLLLFSADAVAGCPRVGPSRLWLEQDTLAPTTPLVVFTENLGAEAATSQLRVRGSDGRLVPVQTDELRGTVRLTPDVAWPDGSVTIERRALFGADGLHVEPFTQAPTHAAWAPVARVQVEARGAAIGGFGDVHWTTHDDERGLNGPSITVETRPPDGALWVDLELQGAGVVGRRVVDETGPTTITTRGVVCRDRYGIPLPLGQVLRMRVVAHGDGGARSAGAWTDVGPLSSDSRHASPSLSEVRTWSAVDVVRPPGEPIERQGSCSGLQQVGVERRTVAMDTALLVDQLGRAYEVSSDDGARIDGVRIEGLSRPPTALARQGPRLFARVEGTRIVAIEGGRVVASATIDAHAIRGIDVDGDVRVTVIDTQDRRWLHRFSPDLTELAPRMEVVDPIEVREWGDGGWAVNGRLVVDLGVQVFVGRDRVAFIEARPLPGGQFSQHVRVVDPHGRTELVRPTPAGSQSCTVELDDLGVAVECQTSEQTVIEAWTFDGSPRFVPSLGGAVDHRFGRGVTRRPWGTRTLAQSGRTAWVEADDGVSTGLPLRSGAVVAPDPLDPDVVVASEIVWTSVTERVREDTRYRCTDDGLGIPARWSQP